jgi:hypothetical protein
MMFMTVFIMGKDRRGVPTWGTGFFYDITLSENEVIPIIITNKHVVADMVRGGFAIHRSDPKDRDMPLQDSLELSFDNFCDLWIMHPDPKIDLCGAPLVGLLHFGRERMAEIFRSAMSERFICSDDDLLKMRGIENVIMAGYPAALWDNVNNFPLLRRGITATHPGVDFQGRHDGVVDLATFAGSSGSPIFLMDEGMVPTGIYTNGVENWRVGSRLRLLGVLYGQYTLDSNNEIKLKPIPATKKQSNKSGLSVHLGCYHKAKEILPLGEEIKRLHGRGTKTPESI